MPKADETSDEDPPAADSGGDAAVGAAAAGAAPAAAAGAHTAPAAPAAPALATLTLAWCRGLDVAPLTRCAALTTLRVQHCCCLTGVQALAHAPRLAALEWGAILGPGNDAIVKDGLLLLWRMVQDHVSSSPLKLVPGGDVLEQEEQHDDEDEDDDDEDGDDDDDNGHVDV